MKHFTSPSFWGHFNKQQPEIQKLAEKNFQLLKENPNHPSLHLKKVLKYYSVRAGIRHRALAVEIKEGLLWFWIGTHSEYEELIK